ncbi:hypothetical protein MARPU_12020 [Marichromatium purpuratum 984]|uniref:Uncharacterized protein n=1 Tax=Marichromatium purpuratum 984 TaxID=765910 RepID=W0E0S7_MARPU|nr:hypothetical protein [Marichromatium purpuratum]AHF04490.1 hypothetical protein MARPU_12020 [Marichromatium purpuratum 984]
MRLIIIAIVSGWVLVALALAVRVRVCDLEARLSAAYFVFWPVAAISLLLQAPVPGVIALPALLGFLPWFLSGPYLWARLRRGAPAMPEAFIGIAFRVWGWGILLSMLLGLFF